MLIKKECRRLQNSGFLKISAYFNKRFGINFNDFSDDIRKIVEYHDRRHLIVHRLGRTDAKYRHDYNIKDKKLKVSKRYLADCFENIRSFAKSVNSEVVALIQQGSKVSTGREPTGIIYVDLQLNTSIGEQVVSSSHPFLCGDEIVLVKDLVFSHENADGIHTLGIRGPTKHITSYLKYIKRFKRDNSLTLLDVRFERWISPNTRNLPDDFLNKIEEGLPEEPWPNDLYKQVAAQFGITGKQAKRAIRQIKAGRLSDEVMRAIEDFLPNEPWPMGLHAAIAERFGISKMQAYHATRKIKSGKTNCGNLEDNS